jgi:Ca-activated chloride channel family protein
VFRSGTELVALNVTVTDHARRYVVGLTRGDFAVYEDGVRQDVQLFESSSVPLDLILLLDTSASMRDRIALVHEAAVGFLETLRDGDRGAIVSFSDNAQVVQGLTEDRTRLEAAIRATTAEGATALHNAVYIALKQFGQLAAHGEAVRRQAIALLSDGDDTSSLISFDDVLQQARRSGVSIYTIALKSKYAALQVAAEGRRYFSESEYEMKMLAQETGGQAFFPLAVRELDGIYDTIAEELSCQYSIGYSSKNRRRDGEFRRVVVRVTTRPELRPRTRTGYLAETERRAISSYVPYRR